MTAPAFPSGTFATDGRASGLATDRGAGGHRQPPADAGGFADIISKLAAAPQVRGDAPAASLAPGGSLGASVDSPAASGSSETAPAVPVLDGPDGRSAGPRAEARGEAALLSAALAPEAAGAAKAAGLARLGLPAAEFLSAAATAPATAAAIDGGLPRPAPNGFVPPSSGTSPRPGTSEPLATALADVALSASLAAGEPSQPTEPRHAPDGARATVRSPATPGRGAWPMPVMGAAEAATRAPAAAPAATDAAVPDLATADLAVGERQPADQHALEIAVHNLDVSGSGVAMPSADPAAPGMPDGTTAPVPPTAMPPAATPASSASAGGSPTAAVPTAAAAAKGAGAAAPTDPAAPLPAEAGVAETPAAAPERTAERVTATVRDMRTHFAPVAPRRAALPADATAAPGPAAGATAPETGPDQAPASSGATPKPALPATPAAAAAPAAAAGQPPSPSAPVDAVAIADTTGQRTGDAVPAAEPEAGIAGRNEGRSPIATDRFAAAGHRDERPAPAHGGSTEPVRSREPTQADADRRAATTAGVTPTVESPSPATGNGFPAALNTLAKEIGDAARAAAAGTPGGPGQPATPSGLANATPGAHALRRDVEIDLSSSELGVVKVRMRLTGSSLEVRLRTDDAATLTLLADRRAELERSISESGVEARIVDVTRATAASGTTPQPGPGPQSPSGGDGREAPGQRFDQGASPERQDHRRPTDDHQTYGTTPDEDQPHRTGPRAGTLFV